jgi:hypothetical protein
MYGIDPFRSLDLLPRELKRPLNSFHFVKEEVLREQKFASSAYRFSLEFFAMGLVAN